MSLDKLFQTALEKDANFTPHHTSQSLFEALLVNVSNI